MSKWELSGLLFCGAAWFIGGIWGLGRMTAAGVAMIVLGLVTMGTVIYCYRYARRCVQAEG